MKGILSLMEDVKPFDASDTPLTKQEIVDVLMTSNDMFMHGEYIMPIELDGKVTFGIIKY